MNADRPAPGIRRRKTCWQVFARVHGRFCSKSYPLKTTLEQLIKHRDALIKKQRLEPRGESGDRATLKDDAKTYLSLVKAMPSYSDRAYHMDQWVEKLGHRKRSSLKARELRETLEFWRQKGRHDGTGLSNGSLNRRRTALMHLYTTLDGKSQPNIVKDVPAYSEHASVQIRAVPMLTVAKVIHRVRVGSKTRARLRVMQWTGWPHKLLQGVTPADVDWDRGRVQLGRRAKGKGMEAAIVPILPRARVALRRFFQLKAQGPFSKDSMRASLTRAAVAADITPFRVYDVRHSFGTWAAGIVKDDRALKALLRTNSIERYTEGATLERMTQAVAQLAMARGQLSPLRSPTLSRVSEVARRRKTGS